MFTLVLNSITASWKSAVSSASVGSEVGVGWSVVAFFVSFNDSVSAFGAHFEEVDGSSVSGLEASGIVGLNTSELGQLAGRDWHRSGEDEPLSIFGARMGGLGTSVVVGSWGGWEESTWVDGGVQVDRLSAKIWHASGTATIDDGQTVSPSLVAEFTVQVINNTVTTFRQLAIGSASVGSIDVSGGTVVAFLSWVSDTVAASWESAVGSAAGWADVRVEWSLVADFSWVDSAVSAFLLASAVASISSESVSVIASLTSGSVDDSVTAFGDSAPRSAFVGGVTVVDSPVALFEGIEDTITTRPQHAVGSACVGFGVAVVNSIVALFSGFQDSVSADNVACLAFSGVGAVASFSIISDQVTASWESAVGSASVGDIVGVGNAIVAFLTSSDIDDSVSAKQCATDSAQVATITSFSGINHVITADWDFAVGSAGVGLGVVVVGTVVAFLIDVDDTITTEGGSAGGDSAT